MTISDKTIEIVLDSASGSAFILTNGVTIGDLTIDDGGGTATFTLGGDLSCGSITLTDGIFDLGDKDVTLSPGSSITHGGGVLTTTTDYGATIDAAGATPTNITASKWISIINGVDGGGNTKLLFGPPTGSLSLLGVGR